jgi:hypothetical protein
MATKIITDKQIFKSQVEFHEYVRFRREPLLGELAQPRPQEPGSMWRKITDPPTGWLATKSGAWTADQFDPGGWEVDFSAIVFAGTRAVECLLYQYTTLGGVYYRKKGDANISNTPAASGEKSHYLLTSANSIVPAVIWLSADYKAEFAVTNTDTDLAISFPVVYLL